MTSPSPLRWNKQGHKGEKGEGSLLPLKLPSTLHTPSLEGGRGGEAQEGCLKGLEAVYHYLEGLHGHPRGRCCTERRERVFMKSCPLEATIPYHIPSKTFKRGRGEIEIEQKALLLFFSSLPPFLLLSFCQQTTSLSPTVYTFPYCSCTRWQKKKVEGIEIPRRGRGATMP